MLVNRNITIGAHRTSIRLEPEFWVGLADIAQREHLSIDALCTEVDRGAGNLTRTAAIRVFIAAYMVRQTTQQPQRSFAMRTSGQTETEQTEAYPAAA
ncbi:MAG: ribbon-helix-helix domain-containing protein [Alphaproteobacteria bacterium]|nr:ribbon-helix-helix domain-containing protein [Alphaproteobacteria bacterium]